MRNTLSFQSVRACIAYLCVCLCCIKMFAGRALTACNGSAQWQRSAGVIWARVFLGVCVWTIRECARRETFVSWISVFFLIGCLWVHVQEHTEQGRHPGPKPGLGTVWLKTKRALDERAVSCLHIITTAISTYSTLSYVYNIRVRTYVSDTFTNLFDNNQDRCAHDSSHLCLMQMQACTIIYKMCMCK